MKAVNNVKNQRNKILYFRKLANVSQILDS